MTVLRYVLRLECGHALLADEEDEEKRGYCPSCGMYSPIRSAYEYRDEDV